MVDTCEKCGFLIDTSPICTAEALSRSPSRMPRIVLCAYHSLMDELVEVAGGIAVHGDRGVLWGKLRNLLARVEKARKP